MRMRSLALTVMCVTTFSAGTGLTQESKPVPRQGGRLHQLAAKARLEGKAELTIETLIVDYPGSESGLNDASQYYGVYIARFIDKKTASFRGNDVMTWYRLKIVDELSPQSVRSLKLMDELDSRARPPANLFALKDDEFVVGLVGGELIIDGIRISRVPHLAGRAASPPPRV